MTSAWLLPEHIADVLPLQARRIEVLRRRVLDAAFSYGYELVIPPLLEHLESLLSGTGHALDLRTFKLVDQLSGRMLGLRADTTPQAARIDAHLLNRDGVTRLCYCGPVAHTLPDGLQTSREPLQFGAEIFGHDGLEADLEVQDLALQCLRAAGLDGLMLDLADARIVRGLLAGVVCDANHLSDVYAALAAKDAPALAGLSQRFPEDTRRGLRALTSLYGNAEVLDAAASMLPERPLIVSAIADLRRLAAHAALAHPGVEVAFDLADLSGYAYYTGARFAVYAAGSHDWLLRGGRYDEVGAVFGRNRPAVGFSADLKELVAHARIEGVRPAVRAPWGDAPGLRAAVQALRAQGETVVCVPPGSLGGADVLHCDRDLVAVDGQWSVRAVQQRAGGERDS